MKTQLASNLVSCRFESDKPVSDRAVLFRNKEDAAGSPLAEKLFALDTVISVKVSPERITITRDTMEDWPSVTRPAAKIIEEHAASDTPAIKADTPSNIRTPEEIREVAEEILKTQINPAVASHGGVIDIIDVKETTVYVKLGGGCHGCGSATATLKQGVERAFREALPELDDVLDTTDHASGKNPYYAPSQGH